jgi:hypothetical protein
VLTCHRVPDVEPGLQCAQVAVDVVEADEVGEGVVQFPRSMLSGIAGTLAVTKSMGDRARLQQKL